MECCACGGEITYAPLLVPRFPRGAFRYCSMPKCVAAAHRRSRVAFPRLSGIKRPHGVRPA